MIKLEGEKEQKRINAGTENNKLGDHTENTQKRDKSKAKIAPKSRRNQIKSSGSDVQLIDLGSPAISSPQEEDRGLIDTKNDTLVLKVEDTKRDALVLNMEEAKTPSNINSSSRPPLKLPKKGIFVRLFGLRALWRYIRIALLSFVLAILQEAKLLPFAIFYYTRYVEGLVLTPELLEILRSNQGENE